MRLSTTFFAVVGTEDRTVQLGLHLNETQLEGEDVAPGTRFGAGRSVSSGSKPAHQADGS